MTCPVLTPWWRERRAADPGRDVPGSREPTRILDWRSPAVADLVRDARALAPAGDRELLRAAHALISQRVRAVYALDDAQPASRTLARGAGSCSQRLAVLEAVARAAGVKTRVRGLLVDGTFWYPRFPGLHWLVPGRVLLAWPEFALPEGWVQAAELFGSLDALAERSGRAFTNADGETLFEALASTAVDWDGATSTPAACSACDLSARVVADLGRYDSRDALFETHGQTLCAPARLVAEPVLRRRTARKTA